MCSGLWACSPSGMSAPNNLVVPVATCPLPATVAFPVRPLSAISLLLAAVCPLPVTLTLLIVVPPLPVIWLLPIAVHPPRATVAFQIAVLPPLTLSHRSDVPALTVNFYNAQLLHDGVEIG